MNLSRFCRKDRLYLFVFMLSAVFIADKTAAQSVDFSNCPNCSSTQLNFHTEVNTKYLGLWGTNPGVPSTYWMTGTNKFGGVWDIGNVVDAFTENNWHPLRVPKQIMVGTIDRFGVHDWGTESDWNTHIVPAAGFEDFITTALGRLYADTDEWSKTADGRFTIEAEITPPKYARNTPWFNNITGKSSLINKQVGVYGPFVAERLHGYRPEIHPSEQIWWKENENTTVLLLAADASFRFDELSDYSQQGAIGNPKPWSLSRAQEALIKIPFSIRPGQQATALSIINLHGRQGYYTSAAYPDATTGTTHSISYNGRDVLTVFESSELGQYVGITFEDVCMNAAQNLLQGFVIVKTAIGNGGDENQGFVAMQIDKKEYAAGEEPALIEGNLTDGNNAWQVYNQPYRNEVAFGDIFSSDKTGKGYVDGFIDFNGNGITDLFVRKDDRWLVMYDAKGPWTEINNSSVPTASLRFGDINGDRITDILSVSPQKKVRVSYSGTGGWQNITDAGEQTTDFRVGDFNGDNRTDIVYMKRMYIDYQARPMVYHYNMYVKYSAAGSWQLLENDFNLSGPADYEDNFRFGNFNGDNITDIFRYNSFKFFVYWNGRGDRQEICQPQAQYPNLNSFIFIDNHSRAGYTDVVYVQPGTNVWKFYYEGRRITPGRNIRYNNKAEVVFAKTTTTGLTKPLALGKANRTPSVSDMEMALMSQVKIEPYIMPEFQKGSLTRSVAEGRPVLTYNMDLKYYPGINAGRNPMRRFTDIAAVSEMRTGKSIAYSVNTDLRETGDAKKIALVKGISASAAGSKTQVKFREVQEPLNIESAAYSIGVNVKTVKELPAGEGNWDTWKHFLTSKASNAFQPLLSLSPAPIQKVKSITLEALPLYAVLEKEKLNLAEQSELTKELNKIAYGNDDIKKRELFGNKKIFKISWKASVKNLVTGNLTELAANRLNVSDNRWTDDVLKYNFPNDGNLYELIVELSATDILGNRPFEKQVYKFYNQKILMQNTLQQIESWAQPEAIGIKARATLQQRARDFNSSTFSPVDLLQLLK